MSGPLGSSPQGGLDDTMGQGQHNSLHNSSTTPSQSTIDELTRRINKLSVQLESARAHQARPKQNIPSSCLRPAQPKVFNGLRSSGRDFLTSCKVYMKLLADDFCDESIQVGFALSFMQEGRAGYWRDRYLENLQRDDELYSTWPKFVQEFQKDFFPVNEAMDARNQLESTQYYQGKCSVRDYVDDFQLLVYRANYATDGFSNVMRFRRGLSSEIQNSIAESATGVPAEDDLNAWIAAAERLDLNRQSNQAFRVGFTWKTHSSMLPAKPALSTPPIRTSLPTTGTPAAFVASNSKPPMAHAEAKPLPMGVPMDIDAARHNRSAPVICYRCKQSGHVQSQCPQRFDVHQLSIAELEEELQIRALQQDAEDTCKQGEGLKEDPQDLQDFPQGR
ncbi:hypothetical protein HGRIS_014891 [Hohenbuehelia grisea]|uniref:CCHC-type domain-containing protein n=1 Tax=Hohenbuehelia grisea TaxID=104357 RepID=A0ABR3JQR9_9AGAR